MHQHTQARGCGPWHDGILAVEPRARGVFLSLTESQLVIGFWLICRLGAPRGNTACAYLEFDSCVILTPGAEFTRCRRTLGMCLHVHDVKKVWIHLPLNALSSKMPAAVYVQDCVG